MYGGVLVTAVVPEDDLSGVSATDDQIGMEVGKASRSHWRLKTNNADKLNKRKPYLQSDDQTAVQQYM